MDDKHGKQVRKARVEAGLRQGDVARQLGKSKQWLSSVEVGRIRLTMEDAEAIAAVLKTTPGHFFAITVNQN